MLDEILLFIIVIQGFAVWFYEYEVWKMNKERFNERKKWRESKQRQAAKRADVDNLGA